MWTQHTFLVLLRRHLQTMMKAVEELQSEWWVSYVARPWGSHLPAGWPACGTEGCAWRCRLLQVGEGHFVPGLGLKVYCQPVALACSSAGAEF